MKDPNGVCCLKPNDLLNLCIGLSLNWDIIIFHFFVIQTDWSYSLRRQGPHTVLLIIEASLAIIMIQKRGWHWRNCGTANLDYNIFVDKGRATHCASK
jgi:hypothetical protein